MASSGDRAGQPLHSREFLEKLINAASDPIFIKDRQHRWILLNDAVCEFVGMTRESLLGRSDYDIFPLEEADLFWEKDELVFATGVENVNEEKVTDARGITHTIVTKKARFTDDNGDPVLIGICRDVTEQKRAEQLLREREQLLQDIVDNVPAMVSLWGRDLRNRFVNRRANRFNIPYEEFYGRHLREIIGEETVLAHRPYHEAVLNGNEQRFEMIWTAPSGEAHDLQITFVPDRRGDEIAGFYSFGVDITDLKRAQQQMMDARVAAEAANAAKSTFLAQMSHELRTPLNAVIGFTEMLQLDLDHNLCERQRTYLGYIAESAQHQLKLVQDLLDFASVDIGHLKLDIGTVDVQETLRAISRFILPLAEKAGVTVECVPPDLPGVRADPLRLNQTLINLATNAVKYNQRGGWVRIEAIERPGRRIRFAVTDNGKGVRRGQESRLFQPFEKLATDDGAAGGVGLGLALVKRLAEAMGGSVGFERPEHPGSLFWVELPAAE